MQADVIVVGAGQAGCAAALDLAAAGRRVLLLGKPQAKPCAGGVTVKAIRRLRFAIDSLVRERPLQLDLSLNGWRPLHWSLADPMCVLVERAELDDFCLTQARAAGADYHAIRQVTDVRQNVTGVTVTTDLGTFKADAMIAADGAHSPIRRLVVGGEKAAGAYAIEAKLPREKASHYPGMQFDFQAAKGGYGWLFPKGDHINVGLYVSHLRGHLPDRDALKDYARKQLGSDDLDAIQGYPLGTRMGRLLPAAGRVLFAGDALGATEPLLGEGIYGAILTGQLATAALLEHPQNPAAAYRTSLAEWRREVIWLNRIARLFYHTTPLAYGGLHHLLRDSLTRGYAAGLTPLQSSRLLRGAHLP